MTNKRLQINLDNLHRARIAYLEALAVIDRESIERFGKTPHQIDCEEFISRFEEGDVSIEPMTVQEFEESMKHTLLTLGHPIEQ